MPILILLGIAAVCGCISIKENHSKSSKYPFNGTERQRTQWILEQNQKKIDKIIRKYK